LEKKKKYAEEYLLFDRVDHRKKEKGGKKKRGPPNAIFTNQTGGKQRELKRKREKITYGAHCDRSSSPRKKKREERKRSSNTPSGGSIEIRYERR